MDLVIGSTGATSEIPAKITINSNDTGTELYFTYDYQNEHDELTVTSSTAQTTFHFMTVGKLTLVGDSTFCWNVTFSKMPPGITSYVMSVNFFWNTKYTDVVFYSSV